MSLYLFKVGDEVIVNDNARGQYMMTVPGSKGIIISISDSVVLIEFKNLGYGYGGPERFPFHINEVRKNFDLLSKHIPLSEQDKKYEKIIVKIRSLQAKRKAKGYAY